MKLVEALNLLRKTPPGDADSLNVALVCGCTPLHLQTFLAAHLQVLLPGRRVVMQTGMYGDTLGSLERLPKTQLDGAAVILEWSDLDPRLGIRRLGGWGPKDLTDIVRAAKARMGHFERAVELAAENVRLAICLPTLPFPPVSYLPSWQSGAFDWQLRESLARFATMADQSANVNLVNPQLLDRCSPPGDRLDVQSELMSGFPYRLAHTSTVAQLLARLLRPPTPKKGLITDLDDTLWRGIVGEVGWEGISWDLDHHSHVHGLYQQLLRSLAEAGVLVGVASKNDPALVEEAFARDDLVLSKQHVFPMAIHWGPKSESVGRILQAWNIGADSVVFVDDSPTELAEVKAAHGDVECLLFPVQDDRAVYGLLEQLRDLFGKERISEEDGLRLESLRQAAALPEEIWKQGAGREDFLAQADAELTVTFAKEQLDARALELVNKTNQFNLNGKCYTESSWRAHLRSPEIFLAVVAYKDKYGPLGKIAVLTGCRQGQRLLVDTWVMSCRAFARRIEHRCLELLFEKFRVEEILFDLQVTARNRPLREFFAELSDGPPGPGLQLSKKTFIEKCPRLFHRVKGL
jgi:FkbH-like protein